MLSKTRLFVISGPSGSGKTTLVNKLIADKALATKLVQSISFTTRPRRPGERDKKHYFFISYEEFRSKLRQKKILEWTKFLDYYYGTLLGHIRGLLEKNKHILLCLDEKGARKIKKLFPDRAVTIFILPPKISSLKKRMNNPERAIKSTDLKKRMRLAKERVKLSKEYDYSIVNDKLSVAAQALKRLIRKEIRQSKT